MPRLHVYSRDHGLRSFDLNGRSHTVGRGNEADIPLPEERKLSRLHVRIDVQRNGSVTVTDLDTKNGTAFDGQPITTHLCSAGDVLRIGRVHLQVTLTDDDPNVLEKLAAKGTSTSALPPTHRSFSVMKRAPKPTASESSAEMESSVASSGDGGDDDDDSADDTAVSKRPDPPMPIGAVLGSYRLEKQLGRGGMGTVYLARHQAMDTLAAIKVMQHGRDEAALQRFYREARTAFGLAHPNLVRVVHADATPDGQPYLVMDYVDGPNLRQLTPKGGLDEATVVQLLLGMCAGLHAAHSAGLVHRDIKPENILIADGTQPRIADFGLIREAGDESDVTQAQGVIGTPAYMPPEQWNPLAPIDARTDIYALGVTAFFMLTRRTPFASKKSAGVMQEVKQRTRVPLASARPGVSAGLTAIVERMMAWDANDRYPDVMAISQDLAAVRRELAGEAGEPAAADLLLGRAEAVPPLLQPSAPPPKRSSSRAVAPPPRRSDDVVDLPEPEEIPAPPSRAARSERTRSASRHAEPAVPVADEASGPDPTMKWVFLSGAIVVVLAVVLVIQLTGGSGDTPDPVANGGNTDDGDPGVRIVNRDGAPEGGAPIIDPDALANGNANASGSNRANSGTSNTNRNRPDNAASNTPDNRDDTANDPAFDFLSQPAWPGRDARLTPLSTVPVPMPGGNRFATLRVDMAKGKLENVRQLRHEYFRQVFATLRNPDRRALLTAADVEFIREGNPRITAAHYAQQQIDTEIRLRDAEMLRQSIERAMVDVVRSNWNSESALMTAVSRVLRDKLGALPARDPRPDPTPDPAPDPATPEPMAQLRIGWQKVQAGDYAAAVTAFDLALAAEGDPLTGPYRVDALKGRGFSHARLGNSDQATADYDAALDINPDDHDCWYRYGKMLREIGKLDDGELALTRAVRLKSDSALYWLELGLLRFEFNKYRRALDALEKSQALDPSNWRVHMAMAYSLVQLDRRAEAVRAMERALQVVGDDEPEFRARIAREHDQLADELVRDETEQLLENRRSTDREIERFVELLATGYLPADLLTRVEERLAETSSRRTYGPLRDAVAAEDLPEAGFRALCAFVAKSGHPRLFDILESRLLDERFSEPAVKAVVGLNTEEAFGDLAELWRTADPATHPKSFRHLSDALAGQALPLEVLRTIGKALDTDSHKQTARAIIGQCLGVRPDPSDAWAALEKQWDVIHEEQETHNVNVMRTVRTTGKVLPVGPNRLITPGARVFWNNDVVRWQHSKHSVIVRFLMIEGELEVGWQMVGGAGRIRLTPERGLVRVRDGTEYTVPVRRGWNELRMQLHPVDDGEEYERFFRIYLNGRSFSPNGLVLTGRLEQFYAQSTDGGVAVTGGWEFRPE